MLTGQLGLGITVFLLAAGLIAILGVRLSGFADRLADATGLGEAFVGAVMLGGSLRCPASSRW